MITFTGLVIRDVSLIGNVVVMGPCAGGALIRHGHEKGLSGIGLDGDMMYIYSTVRASTGITHKWCRSIRRWRASDAGTARHKAQGYMIRSGNQTVPDGVLRNSMRPPDSEPLKKSLMMM